MICACLVGNTDYVDKDFDRWNEQKKHIHEKPTGKFFHEQEMWWCSLGLNIGYEEDGKNQLYERPVLVIKKFNRDMLWVLPLTRTQKENRYYVRLRQGDEEDSAVILSQLRLISSKRLNRRVRKLAPEQFVDIVHAIKTLFPL